MNTNRKIIYITCMFITFMLLINLNVTNVQAYDVYEDYEYLIYQNIDWSQDNWNKKIDCYENIDWFEKVGWSPQIEGEKKIIISNDSKTPNTIYNYDNGVDYKIVQETYNDSTVTNLKIFSDRRTLELDYYVTYYPYGLYKSKTTYSNDPKYSKIYTEEVYRDSMVNSKELYYNSRTSPIKIYDAQDVRYLEGSSRDNYKVFREYDKYGNIKQYYKSTFD
jgi:hypothetical protein